MYDLVIIGSGATGLYLAYQLSQACYRKLNILLVTGDSEVGGRILSQKFSKTWIEKCAARYYPSQMPLVEELVHELEVPTYDTGPIPVVTPTGDDIIERVLADYPPASTPHPQLIPLNWAITTSSPVGFADVQRFALESGYSFSSNNLNLNFIYHEPPTSGEVERRFTNGFQSLMMALYQQLTVPIMFNSHVENITAYQNSNCDGYMLEVTQPCKKLCILAKKVVYTGTILQLSNLILPPSLQERASILRDSFTVNPSLKIYIKFKKPWWTTEVKYTGDPLFNQLIYYSSNVILLYMIGPLTPKVIHQVTDKVDGEVITPEQVPDLMTEIYSMILRVVDKDIPDQQLYSATSLLVWYEPAAVATAVPGPLLPDNVRYNHNFYIVSGDTLDYGQGWVENAFRAVKLALDNSDLLEY